jgi:RNA polymerase sigma factor (sigma-70 family)
MGAEAISNAALAAPPRRSKRLLALASDERLVEQIRAGNEAAFEVAFERHGPAILGFCRHMLGSVQEAEDAVQHTFASAYRKLLQDDAAVRLKPWLFTIARNRSLSMLRARRESAAELDEIPTTGLTHQVEQRAELRELLADLRDLPDEQRAALLLAEVGDLSHPEVADVLGCEVARVKALVFRARSGLIDRRDARAAPCNEIREQLANLRGGSLRRSELRHHLRVCAGCRDYREQVKRQRRQLAAALPVTPSLGLKSSVLSALGLGGGAGGGTLAGGLGLAASAPVGATVAKVATVAVLVAGGAAVGERAIDHRAPAPVPASTEAAPGPPAGHATPATMLPPPAVRPAPAFTQSQAAAARRSHGKGHAYGHDKAKSRGPSDRARPHEWRAPGTGRGKGAAKQPAPAAAAQLNQAGPKPKAVKQKSAPPAKAPHPAKVKLPNGVARGQK